MLVDEGERDLTCNSQVQYVLEYVQNVSDPHVMLWQLVLSHMAFVEKLIPYGHGQLMGF